MVTLFHGTDTKIVVHGQTRQKFQSVFEVFERNAESSRLERPPKPPPPSPNIFIGHGRSNVWRDLKDHLQDNHGYIVFYEIGARAEHAIREILEDMLNESAIALLVMTGEDEMKDNKLLPWLSVVHELRLFQGHLDLAGQLSYLKRIQESLRIFMAYNRFGSPNAILKNLWGGPGYIAKGIPWA